MINKTLKFKIKDLKENFLNIKNVDDFSIGIYLKLDRIHVFKMTCPHLGGDLCLAKVNSKESTIQCMAHGYFFSMIDGNFLKNPNIKDTIDGRLPNKYFDPNIKRKYRLFMLNNRVEDDLLIIDY